MAGKYCNDNSNHLTIAHLNVQGILSKLEQLRVVLSDHRFHILFLSETWLTEQTPSSFLHMPDYKLERRDRFSAGGGVLAYIHNSIPAERIKSPEAFLSDSISLLVSIPFSKPFISTVVYRPPKSLVS